VLPAALVADANVLLSALIRGRARVILARPHGSRFLAAEAVREEVMRYLPTLARRRSLDLDEVQSAFAVMPVEWQAPDVYSPFRERALDRIRHRDPDDWPTVALALALDLPIWSQDKDLAASGLTVYTTGQLLDALRHGAATTDTESDDPAPCGH
jgi:predicted nucleic acid-binding protein